MLTIIFAKKVDIYKIVVVALINIKNTLIVMYNKRN